MDSRLLAGLAGWAFLFTLACLLLPNGRAHAYLDPGSGSFILQLLLAAVVGGLLTLRVFWARIKGLFTKTQPPSEPEQAAPPSTDPTERS